MRSSRWRATWSGPADRADRALPPGCLELGGGRIGLAGIGSKAALLDRASRAGLPVPAGFVVPDGMRPSASVTAWTDVGSVAVRSAFSAEDRPDESLAGWFDTRLRVGPDAVSEAVEQVRASSVRRPGRFRRDVLVMVMVEASRAGVAFSEPETYDDRINVTAGTAEGLVGGREAGDAEMLPRLETAPAGWRRRFQRLLRSVRREFGDRAWDVEGADDGRRCWLVQLRPITGPTRRNEAFTIANHAEILPPLPSELMAALIEEAGPELFAWYRRFDRSLPAKRPFLEVVAGRPFINLTLLEDLLRHLGLPTRLVADSIGGPPEHDRPARPLRLARKSPVLLRMGFAQVGAVVRARANEDALATIGDESSDTFADALVQLRSAYVGLVTGMFPLSSAIGPPLAVLRKAGTLVEHASRHRTVTTELADHLDRLTVDDDSARRRFLDRFGHRGVYESDIARPRFRDDPSLLGAPVEARTGSPQPLPRSLRGRATQPVWWLARPPLAARERLRHEAMIGFGRIRDHLVRLAALAVADGRLPSVDHLWLLTADEARDLDRGWCPDDDFWARRRAERDRLADLDPPPVVHRYDDPADWGGGDGVPAERLTGLPLTQGEVAGRAWVLLEPSVHPPEGFAPEHTILVARSVDAGWIPTLSLVAAAVVEIGGDLSHGSILLRERGLPAVTNVRGATRTVQTGEELRVRAGAGVVVRSTLAAV